jgi:hypothetical protein
MKTFCMAALLGNTAAFSYYTAAFDNAHGPDTRTDLTHTEDGHGHTINVGLPENHGMVAKRDDKQCSSITCVHDVHEGGNTCGAGRKFTLDTDMGYFQSAECPTMAQPTSSIRVRHKCSGAARKWGGRECAETVCTSGHFCGMDGNNGCICVSLDTTAAVTEDTTTTAPPICCKAMTAACMACENGVTEEEYCASNPSTQGCATKACPADCNSWFDGCNTCTCNNGAVGACTRKFCATPDEPKCLDTTTAPAANSIFLSEYVEGTSYRKAVELYNPTNAKIKLDGVKLVWHMNGKDNTAKNAYTVNLKNKAIKGKKTFVICRKETKKNSFDIADSKCDLQISSNSAASQAVLHNGNDAITLEVDGTVTDTIGTVGRAKNWVDEDGKPMTKDRTIRRNKNISTGNTEFTTSEWFIKPKNRVAGLGQHNFQG